MLHALRSTPQPRWPERALSNAFVRNVAQAGRYCYDCRVGRSRWRTNRLNGRCRRCDPR